MQWGLSALMIALASTGCPRTENNTDQDWATLKRKGVPTASETERTLKSGLHVRAVSPGQQELTTEPARAAIVKKLDN